MVHEMVNGTFRQTNLTNESDEYLAKREELRLAEIELMRQSERVAAMRRRLPAGAIVQDYVATQEPVGSKALVERHNLGVSPATIRNDMAALEVAYKDWIFLKAGADATRRATKLKAFIDTLFAVRNIYPSQNLHECDAPEKEEKFLLGQTALGTMKE